MTFEIPEVLFAISKS